jgi:tripartite-type tricarboxylate transporter receptor subunit TctC
MNKLAVLILSLFAATASAQDASYPNKPVRLVVPFAPGGASDALARLVADKLSRSLGQTFVVENRGGAGGMLGSDLVAKSPPDGYTLVVSGIASHVIAPASTPNPPFDPLKSFTHIALFGGPPSGLTVNPNLPARTVGEFVALSKSKPGGISFGSAGHGTHSHLIGELFRQKTGANLTHIPYKGAAPAVADVVAGHLPASFTGTFALPQAKAGKIRYLAITGKHRLAEIPDVPTFGELGMKELTTTTWFGLSGPAGMPRDIVTKLNLATRAALKLPDVREKLEREGTEADDLDPEGFAAFVKSELDLWGPIARSLGPETK